MNQYDMDVQEPLAVANHCLDGKNYLYGVWESSEALIEHFEEEGMEPVATPDHGGAYEHPDGGYVWFEECEINEVV